MLQHTYRTRNGRNGRCGVEMFRSEEGQLIVMLTELPDNPGTSITNCFEIIATDIVRGLLEFNLVADPSHVRWIEHYAHGDRRAGEDWDEVVMQWNGAQYLTPAWQPCNGDRYRKPVLGDPCHEQLLIGLFQSL